MKELIGYRLSAIGYLVALLALLVLAPVPAFAQEAVDWRERPGQTFNILYAAGYEAEADRYAAFVDTIYEEIATTFSFRTATPLTLRLYPTSEDYYQINPLARNVPGVVAHADFRRRELVVIVERTLQQSEEEVRNNIRHELTHIVAADLSGSRLNTGFQEGIAQYLELPTAELEQKIRALALARDQGRLLPWSAFDSRDQIYGDPSLGYPQSLSVVAFLIERDGFAKFRDFLVITARSSGYRSALDRTYGVSPAVLEAAWLDWLPSYIQGGYQRSAVQAYDTTYARGLVEQGRYGEAAAELEQALEWMRKSGTAQPAEVISESEALLARAREGTRANQLAEAARAALETAKYTEALDLIAQARSAYAALEDPRQEPVLAAYSERANRGLRADAQLAQAGELARAFQFPQARAAADAAAGEFAALGDSLRLGDARALRQDLDQRQRLAGAVLIVVGAAGVILSLIGRLFQRPAEVW